MGTTLGFDVQAEERQHSKACIIATGEFTTCYNLLSYIEKLAKQPGVVNAAYSSRLSSLKEQLTKDYEQFKTDPFFIYNENGIAYGIKDFKKLTMADIPDPRKEN